MFVYMLRDYEADLDLFIYYYYYFCCLAIEMNTFHSTVGGLVSLVDKLAAAVDDEKMKAIGARAAMESLSKKRESEEQLLLSMIAERRAQLDR